MKSLCIITHGYPCNANRISQPFTREFAHAAARQGVKVTVIAPLAVHLAFKGKDPLREIEHLEDGSTVEVFRPRYLSISDKRFFRWNTRQIGLASFYRATRNVARRGLPAPPEALYGHFLYLGGATAVRLGQEMGIPAFVMVGDGKLNSAERFGIHRMRRHFSSDLVSFLPNSSSLGTLLVEQLDVSPEKLRVFPNGINHNVFFRRDKTAARDALGLPQDLFLVISVGHQDLQKGPVRVGEAIRGLGRVGGVFLGSGSNPPIADNIVFNEEVTHDKVPEWMAAADLFVLPSTYEGCCNAILEAMACGLPVVASEGDFNDDILNADVSLRVDPMDVSAIRSAIVRLRDDHELRRSMGRAAAEWSRRFNVDERARGILSFIEDTIG